MVNINVVKQGIFELVYRTYGRRTVYAYKQTVIKMHDPCDVRLLQDKKKKMIKNHEKNFITKCV